MGERPKVLMVVTLDTKEVEARFIRQCLEDNGLEVYHLDASIRRTVDGGAEITPDRIAAAAGTTVQEIRALNHEGKCLTVMVEGAIHCAHELDQRIGLSGMIGVGGSMGTVLGTAIMRTFPFGLPKVMVSTILATRLPKTSARICRQKRLRAPPPDARTDDTATPSSSMMSRQSFWL